MVQAGGADTPATSHCSVDGQGMLQEQLQQVAGIMESVGRQGRMSSAAVRELLALASARILLLTMPMDEYLRSLVCRRSWHVHDGGCDGGRAHRRIDFMRAHACCTCPVLLSHTSRAIEKA